MSFCVQLKVPYAKGYGEEYDNLVITDSRRPDKSYSISEWNETFPFRKILIYNPEIEDDVSDAIDDKIVFAEQMTPNLVEMARFANLYEAIWEPESVAIKASDLIERLTLALRNMTLHPAKYKVYEAGNKDYGTFEWLLQFTQKYLAACQKYPDAKVCKF